MFAVAFFGDTAEEERWVIYGAVLVFGAVFSAHFFTARGAWQKKPGARTASQVIAVLMLLGVPIGTLIGIYLLVQSSSPWEETENV